jgi:glycine/D-amino acid oxidase-like deaminating enzyme
MGEEIYIAGLNSSSIPLPNLATDSKIDPMSIGNLKKTAKRLLGTKLDAEDLEIVREGLCFRPATKKGVPIIARIPDKKLGAGMKTRGGIEGGIFLAAGHGPWGISNSLGTGKVMAEMMMGKKTSVDISGLGL